jgi:hypothetical protein
MTVTKGTYSATDAWVDITTVFTGIANISITLTGHNSDPCEVVFGGAAAPTIRGEVIGRDDVLGGVTADHIWVRAIRPGASVHVVVN